MSERRPSYDDRLKDYVDVKERLKLFYAAHPDGRVVTTKVRATSKPDGVPRVWVEAAAYRTADDPLPGRGWSWLVLPGSTPYTRGSEIENAETSAWGRAIGATGIGIDKSIASADEVRAKEGHDEPEPEPDILRDGLIGTVERGKPPVDMELRQTPDGPAWGFKLKNGRRSYQVLATGELADAVGLALGTEDLVGQRVTVWGHVELIPWRKGDRDMPPYPRVNLTRLATPSWTLPAPEERPQTPAEPEVDSESTEAPSEPLFPDQLTDEERAAVGGGLP